MPALQPGGTNLFDPLLDPIWAAIEDVGLPISQHGGASLPGYSAPGFAMILTVSIENGFYSAGSLWQMIAGGVFDLFPVLKRAFVETQRMFLVPAIAHLDMTLGMGDDWMAFPRFMKRERTLICRWQERGGYRPQFRTDGNSEVPGRVEVLLGAWRAE